MLSSPPPTPSPSAAHWPQRLHAALMPDYNRAAATYWWTVVLLGLLTCGVAVGWLLHQPPAVQLQVLVGCGVAMLAGLFPVRVPGSKNSFAAGEVFIMLLLLVHGPWAGVLAAAGEAFVGSARTSKRWTSRLISPSTAAVSLLAMGTLMQATVSALALPGALGLAVELLGAMGFAIGYFMLNTLLITLVLQLKRGERLSLQAYLGSFGWVGITYAASAVLAGLLHVAFKSSGVGVMLGAVPLIIVLLVMLHYHFRQRELDETAQVQRIEAAEREAAQSARHLQQLRESEQRFHRAFSHAAIGMALVTPEGLVLQANPAMQALLETPEAALIGTDFRLFVHPEDLGALARQWQALLAREPQGDTMTELRCRRPHGAQVVVALHSGHFDDSGGDSVACLILQAQDITARRDAENQLQHIAYHDGLTSLANRIRFGACLGQAIARCQVGPPHCFAVMYLDFDRFKLINDTLGHSAGDRFLTLVAQRISASVRPVDTVGRLGGDEFAVLVEDVPDEDTVLAMADRLQQCLAAPYNLDGTQVNSSASIGITFSSVGYDSPGDVLRDADIAMYRAKSAGRARTAVFDASLRAQLAEQVNMERALRRAIEQQQLALAYQPICDLATGQVDSFEALVRWDHPELGSVPPGTFVPIAEESAMIGALTGFVLTTACKQLADFQRQLGGAWKPGLHVNVSGTDMCRTSFVQQVTSALLLNGLSPQQLTLEITETTLMKRLDSALAVMGQLRELGVGLSVDDFGTGYSSLSYLSTLPITSLKIDRSFVQRLQSDAREAEVVKAVITLGRALGKTVIAEGIETPGQLQQLRTLGCGFGQGYLLARPLSPDQALAMVQGRHWPQVPAPATSGTALPTPSDAAAAV